MSAPDERFARAAAASRPTDMTLLLLLSVVAGLVDVTNASRSNGDAQASGLTDFLSGA